MSTARVALVRIAMQAYCEGDPEVALAMSHPLIRFDERPAEPDAELVWGRERVEREMFSFLDQFDDYTAVLEELIDAGEKVVGVYRERGTLADSGLPVNRRRAAVWTVDPKWIVDWTVYLSKREAMGAAGLDPDSPEPAENPVRTAPEPK
jgi:ketosteroid isomerase-like protein